MEPFNGSHATPFAAVATGSTVALTGVTLYALPALPDAAADDEATDAEGAAAKAEDNAANDAAGPPSNDTAEDALASEVSAGAAMALPRNIKPSPNGEIMSLARNRRECSGPDPAEW